LAGGGADLFRGFFGQTDHFISFLKMEPGPGDQVFK
jgi:hypothetical protein